MRRVVVTGLGVISPIGNDVDTFWDNLVNGRSGITYVPEDRFKTEGLQTTTGRTFDLKTNIGGFVRDFDITQYIDIEPSRLRMGEYLALDPFSQYAIAASVQATRDSGIVIEEDNNIATVIGSGLGGLTVWEQQYKRFLETGRVSSFTTPGLMSNAGPGNVSIYLGLRGGPNHSTAGACASGTIAPISIIRAIRLGDCDVGYAGGTEAVMSPFCFATFYTARAMVNREGLAKIKKATDASDEELPMVAARPFDRDRQGFVMSEGAGIIVLEEYEHARARGAEVYAEVIGYGESADAHDLVDIDAAGPAKAMKKALTMAGLDRVDYINAHGTGTQPNDPAETEAIKRTFGEETARQTPISSTKSITGHLMGGAGGVEAIAAILSIYHGVIPPTINLDHPDVEGGCDLDYVPHNAREADVQTAMTNSFGFGGHNAVIIFRKPR